MNIKRVTPRKVAEGKWRNLKNFLFEVEILVFSNIQAISTPVCLEMDDMGS